MWVFLTDSFVSIVRDTTDPEGELLLVRGRQVGDIERFLDHLDVDVSETPGHDYRFRTSVDRAEVAQALARHALRIQYPNFKDTVKDARRHWAYMDVWAAMKKWQGWGLVPALSRKRKRPRGMWNQSEPYDYLDIERDIFDD